MDATAALLSSLSHRDMGAQLEAHIFAFLSTRADVYRSFEFGCVDGALALADSEVPNKNYADKFWELEQRLSHEPGSQILIPFDVKSRVSSKAEEQMYVTTIRQRQCAAFYICVCAANPRFVEVIPNQHGGKPIPHEDVENPSRHVVVNYSRKSLVQPSAYHSLSPCNSLYRMPLPFLHQAIENIRASFFNDTDYVNPWTRVCFGWWRPHWTDVIDPLVPNEHSQAAHFTAYEGTSRIGRAILAGVDGLGFDFVYLQPALADFKLTVDDPQSPSRGQWFVQYKIDGRERPIDSPLRAVPIARRHTSRLSYYFHPTER